VYFRPTPLQALAGSTPRPSATSPTPRAASPAARVDDESAGAGSPVTSGVTGGLKDALLAEIRTGKSFFYNMVVAQAQSIEVGGDRVTFTFLPTHKTLREQFDQTRPWLEAAAERIAGRKITVVAVQAATAAAASAAEPAPAAPAARDLKAQALSSTTVQAVLDVFPAEIRDVEEL
jgi:hypothetical protein